MDSNPCSFILVLPLIKPHVGAMIICGFFEKKLFFFYPKKSTRSIGLPILAGIYLQFPEGYNLLTSYGVVHKWC